MTVEITLPYYRINPAYANGIELPFIPKTFTVDVAGQNVRLEVYDWVSENYGSAHAEYRAADETRTHMVSVG